MVGNVCEPDCAAEYSLASCPANGNCTICGGKYKLESCVSPYTKNGNTCTLNLTGPYVLKARGTLGTPNVYTNMPGSVPADGPNSITVPAGAFKTGTPGVSYTRFSVAVFSCRGTNASDCATFNDYNKTDCPDSNGGNALFGV
ncbi:hypothetical protein FACS1894176_01550 [Bacteroidia bacterium]|nr:hypothetical protein FACS189428_6090 [Clostridia bacterium]GHV24690.1 hypothetical protein FACS1894176_01550 [Bacteroidia bacterium]